MNDLRASIVISSYNYARFLPVAIDSALAQTYQRLEVIVVDDGSRDDSAEVIRGYGSRIIPLIKSNGGQASAFNEGVKLSRGDVIIFLDSDDYLAPDTVARAVELFRDPAVAKVHWNLEVVDESGTPTNTLVRDRLSEGDLRDVVLRKGPDGYSWPPTSGNAWARRYLETALPIPELEFNTCPDLYLATLAPLYGTVKAISQPQGFWRCHPVNASFRDSFADNLRDGLRRAEQAVSTLERHAQALGLQVDPKELRFNSRWHQMKLALDRIEQAVHPGIPIILLDLDHWKAGKRLGAFPRFHFTEKDGEFWGLPADDRAAIDELERLRGKGAGFFVIPWPYGWTLDHYRGLDGHLRLKYRVAYEDASIAIFDLRG